MAGIERDTPIPTDIKLHQKSRFVELIYESGDRHELDYEFLRVFTPSAEARGHGPGQETLQTGKRNVSNPLAPTHCASCFPTATTAASTPGICFTTWASIATSCGRSI